MSSPASDAGPDALPVLELTAYDAFSLPMLSSDSHVLRRLAVRNPARQAWDRVGITVSAEPEGWIDPHTLRLDGLAPLQQHELYAVDLPVSPEALARLEERTKARLTLTVEADGEVVHTAHHALDLLPPQVWPGLGLTPQLLAAWVCPNAKVLVPVLKAAGDHLAALTGSDALCGYQKRDPRHVWRMAEALWQALLDVGISYIEAGAGFEETGQRIRTHADVLDDRLGNCLDLTVLLAALLEQCGLHPLLIVVEGHAFVGVWLTDFHLHEPTHDDPLPIRKRVELGEALVLDSSPLASGASFDEARRSAEAMLADVDRYRLAVDVRSARQWGVRPMVTGAPAGAPLEKGPAPRTGDDVVPTSVSVIPDRFGTDDEEVARGKDRIDRWASKLLDLSLRNRLLNFREGKKTVPLVTDRAGAVEDQLAQGGVALLPRPDLRTLPSDDDAPDRTAREQLKAVADAALDKGRALTDLLDTEHDKRLLELYRSSRSALRDSGAVTLYLAVGMLHWYEAPSSDTLRRAPLLLVPVALERPTGTKPWRLIPVDDEPRINVTLLEKLDHDFGLSAPGLGDVPTDEHGVDVPKVLRRFRTLVKDQARWEVRDALWLGQFSFTKFLMWLDLQAKRDALLASPVVQHMFDPQGETYPLAAPLVGEAELDEGPPPAATTTVMNADPSQLQAVLAAVDGSSFVLQGPPGTGKSQTITNLIGQLLDEGRTVLFVSEKMAALHVVRDRLARVGLGPFCLELHSPQASKRGVMEQIKDTFAWADAAPPEGWTRHLQQLDEARSELNAHAERLATPTPFGRPARDVLAAVMGLSDLAAVPLPDVDALALTDADVAAHREAMHAVVVALSDVGDLSGHPWRGVGASRWTPAWASDVTHAADTVATTATALRDAADEVAALLELDGLGHDPAILSLLEDAASALHDPPAMTPALLGRTGLTARLDTIRGWADEIEALSGRVEALHARWKPELLSLDLDPLRERFQAWAESFFLFAWVMLFTARRQLAPLAVEGLPGPVDTRDQLDDAATLHADLADFAERTAQAGDWLGDAWLELDTDTEALRALCDRAQALHRVALQLADHTGDFAASDRILTLATTHRELLGPTTRTGATLQALGEARSAHTQARAALVRLAELDEREAFGETAPLDAVIAWATRAADAEDRLRGWCAATRQLATARGLGQGPILDALFDGDLALDDAEDTLERALHQGWWDAWLATQPELATFRGRHHADLVARFRQLDDEALGLARQATVARVAERMPDLHAPGEQMALLRRQLQLKTRHRPLRELFRDAGDVLRALKPCVLMSPLSVAKYLDPTDQGFDVVVFDEASQIPPWDAVGAIARGQQVIVVGDSKQLPPTTFFATGDDDTEPDDEDLEELESILDEAVASGFRELRLRWHYRSRHESLIAFSNHHYYDNRLHTFPSADDGAEGRGVELVPVPEGYYDRGKSRTNRAEAEAAVAELLRLLRLPDGQRPTVGVVTFNMKQQRLIEDLLDAALADAPELAVFASDQVEEPVFVKNLENVQGDERDVMLFSVGYGPDRTGKVTMNFGPLNRKGGERRLNVAITRARERLVVFSTLRHDQIDLARTRAVGVHHLKRFLQYAEQGMVALDAALTVRDRLWFESPFEEQVHGFLTAQGYEVHTQVGCSGYRIDLAVVDPRAPGAYLIAVECDGATYHGSANARERDRLRDAVLGGLGWRIHRVWSTDWFYEREATEAKLLAAVEAAEQAPRTHDAPAVPEPPAPEPPAPVAPVPDGPSFEERLAQTTPTRWPDDASPWRGLPALSGGARSRFHEASGTSRLAEHVRTVVEQAGPVHSDDAWRHISRAWGYKRLGSRIVARLDELVRRAGVDRYGDLLYPEGQGPRTWRTFRYHDDDSPERDIDRMAPAELLAAAEHVLSLGLAMQRETLARETAKVFGWQQLGSHLAEVLDGVIDEGLAQGRLVQLEDGQVRRGA